MKNPLTQYSDLTPDSLEDFMVSFRRSMEPAAFRADLQRRHNTVESILVRRYADEIISTIQEHKEQET